MVKWFSPTDTDNVCTILDSNSNKTYTLELPYLELSDIPPLSCFTGLVGVAQSKCALLTRQVCTAISSHACRASPDSGGLKLKVAYPYRK